MLNFIKHFSHLVRVHWLTFGFILGFITDLILLNRIDDLVDNLILLFYVLLATTAMLFLYMGVAERGPQFASLWMKKYSPLLMQYAFGGLLSGMLIFYGRSGDWLASAPFLLLILGVILGNEFVGKRSDRLVYNLALYFIGLFSYIVLVIPVISGMMGDWIFIGSGLIALMIVTFVVRLLHKIVPNFMEANVKRVITTIGFIYIGFNTLYFTSVIPPIPLSLTELEIVQRSVKLESGGYRVESEVQPWFRKLPFMKPVLHPKYNSVSCFARVFAPTRLSTDIYHRWEYKDEEGHWHEHFRFGYEISGANKGGYGGYTVNENFFDGVWRCSVETERGQVLGRYSVVIDTAGELKSTDKNEVQIR
tara:strand:- start:327 stop:1415 length:1089 start_codon:yes stop_codon:yes gene_type:complete